MDYRKWQREIHHFSYQIDSSTPPKKATNFSKNLSISISKKNTSSFPTFAVPPSSEDPKGHGWGGNGALLRGHRLRGSADARGADL
jgi:hypothetical protein